MAITKKIKVGTPADNAEITEAATFIDKLDDATAGTVCASQQIETNGESIKAYDAKQAFTYASGTWEIIVDTVKGPTLIDLRIVVTNAAGAQQRIIHDFGNVTFPADTDDVTFTATGVAEQVLTATERLAVFMIINDPAEERMRVQVDNFSTSCDSRLITPDEAVAGIGAAEFMTMMRQELKPELKVKKIIEVPHYTTWAAIIPGGLGDQDFIIPDVWAGAEVLLTNKDFVPPDTFSGAEVVLLDKDLIIPEAFSGVEALLITKDLIIAEALANSDVLVTGKDIIIPDAFAGSEVAVVVKDLLLAEGFTGSDVLVTGKDIITTDTLVGTDTLTFVKELVFAEAAAFADVLIQIKDAILSDAFSGAETLTFGQEAILADSLLGAEVSVVDKEFLLTESFTGTEVLDFVKELIITDTMSSTEIAIIVKELLLTEAFSAIEVIELIKTLIITDSLLGTDIAVIGQELLISDDLFLDDIKSITFPNLIAHIKFKNNVLDETAGNNDGTWTGTEQYVKGPIDKAGDFDGSSLVTLANEGNFDREHNQPFSFGAWVKPVTGLVENDILFGKGNIASIPNPFVVFYGVANSHVVFRIRSDTTTIIQVVGTNNTVPLDEITHILCTFSGNSNQNGMKIYINGILDVTGAAAAISGSILNNLATVIGMGPEGAARHWHGLIDDFQFYDDELTAAEVYEIYTGGMKVTKDLILTDSMSGSEVLVFVKELLVADSISFSDALIQVKDAILSDTFSGSDVLEQIKDAILTESMVGTELAVIVKELLLTDTFTGTDALEFVKELIFSETLNMTDVLVTGKDIILSDTLSNADVLQIIKDLIIAEAFAGTDLSIIIEDVIIEDTFTGTETMELVKILIFVDTFNAADSVLVSKEFLLIDTFAGAETVTLTKELILPEVMAFADVLLIAKDIIASDNLTGTDLVVISKEFLLTDSLSFVDALEITKVLTFAETFSGSDTLLNIKDIIISESLLGSDVVVTGKDIILTQSFSITDAVLIDKEFILSDTFAGADVLIHVIEGLGDEDHILVDTMTSVEVVVMGKTLVMSDSLSSTETVEMGKDLVVPDSFTGSDILQTIKDLIIPDVFIGSDVVKITKELILNVTASFTDALDFVRAIVTTDDFFIDDTKDVTFANLQAHIKFNNDVLDSSGNANNGTITGIATFVRGVLGLAGDIGGGKINRVNLANEANFDYNHNSPFSVFCHVKYTGGGNQTWVGKGIAIVGGVGWYFFNNGGVGDGRPFINLVSVGGTVEIRIRSSIITNDGKYHRVLVTLDGSGLASGVNIYVDGILDLIPSVQRDNLAGGSILNNETVSIGSSNIGSNSYTGEIDDVQIYDRELTAAEAHELGRPSVDIDKVFTLSDAIAYLDSFFIEKTLFFFENLNMTDRLINIKDLILQDSVSFADTLVHKIFIRFGVIANVILLRKTGEIKILRRTVNTRLNRITTKVKVLRRQVKVRLLQIIAKIRS